MYLENLAPSEVERIAYLTGDTMAASAFGELSEQLYEVQKLEFQIEDLQTKNLALDDKLENLQEQYDNLLSDALNDRTSGTLVTAMQTIATCHQHPGKPTRKQLDALSRAILEITACPGDYSPESARQAIYSAFGHDVS